MFGCWLFNNPLCAFYQVSNWEDQFSSHIKKDSIKLYVYHGADRTTKGKELAKFDIVLTTYNILSLEYSRVQRSEKASSLLHSIRWHRIVLDEAHIIKDSNTAQSKSACSLPSSRRWCLSGTPVQNRLEDLYSLVKFLRLDPFSNKHVWSYFFKNVSSKGNELSVSRLQV